MERLLAEDCHVVGSVPDGDQVVEAARRLEPDVILLDINMPNVSGLEACRQVAQLLPKVKVIVVTVNTDPAIMRAAFAAGAVAFIPKYAVGDRVIPAIMQAWSDRRGVMPNGEQDGVSSSR